VRELSNKTTLGFAKSFDLILGVMITWIPYTGYGTMEQRENPSRNESFTKSKWLLKLTHH
jgi:hypothetical protein